MKFGKKPFVADERDLKLATYLDHTKLPKPPEAFGHADLVKDWGMLGNDTVGDCVFAGAAHETLVLGAEGDHYPTFTDEAVLSDYSAVTGYVPGDASTDQGTDVREAVSYRRKTGMVDANGKRHHIGAFLYLEPGNFEQLRQALYLFGAAGIGYELPESAMQQFDQTKPWTVVDGSPIAGGHYVPAFGCEPGEYTDKGVNTFITSVSWGRVVPVTDSFYEKYCDEAVVYVSASALGEDGKTPEGFDKAALLADLKALA